MLTVHHVLEKTTTMLADECSSSCSYALVLVPQLCFFLILSFTKFQKSNLFKFLTNLFVASLLLSKTRSVSITLQIAQTETSN